MGATLLVFANKTDISGGMSDDEVQQVRIVEAGALCRPRIGSLSAGVAIRRHQDSSMEHRAMQRNDRRQSREGY